MLTNDDLQAIKKIVKAEVDPVKQDLGSVKKQLDTVEIKVEVINKRVEQSQRETIDALSSLIHAGYSLHDERIKKIENQLKTSQAQ